MAFVCVMLWQVRPKMGPAHWFGLMFIAWCFASVFWSVGSLDTIHQCFHLLLLTGVFLVASAEVDLRPTVAALGCGVAISAVVAMLQLHGYQPVNAGTAGGASLFLNKDFFAEVASLSLLLSTGFGLWAFVPGALYGVLVTASRSAWLATLAGGVVLIWWRLPSLSCRVALLTLLPIVVGAAIYTDLALHPGQSEPINDRIAFWQYTFVNLSWLGYGLGTYPLIWPGWNHAHNELLELAFEVGLGVVPLLGVFIYAFGGGVSTAAQAALASVLVSAFLYFPFHQPATAFLAALLAGHLCGARDRLRCAQPTGRIYSWEGAFDTESIGAGALCRADLSRADLSVRPQSSERT